MPAAKSTPSLSKQALTQAFVSEYSMLFHGLLNSIISPVPPSMLRRAYHATVGTQPPSPDQNLIDATARFERGLECLLQAHQQALTSAAKLKLP